jgi:3-dehydroquinate synthase
MEKRKPYYSQADFVIDTTSLTIDGVRDKILSYFSNRLIEIVKIDLGERSYNIYIGEDTLSQTGRLFKLHKISKNVVIITNPLVDSLYGSVVKKSLEKVKANINLFLIPDGEKYKTLTTINQLYTMLIKRKIERNSTVLALGGGVIGDIAGFTAATYMRGLPLVQIPTTFLSQVDSAIGGKVSVNHPLGKNLIGAFYQPKLVIVDPSVLGSLSIRDIASGLGEIIKYGVIYDAEFFTYLEKNLSKIKVLNPKVLLLTIKKCCEIKTHIVSEDEHEMGKRIILNFGHTIGHAIEAVTNYQKYRHGEAIIMGMLAAARISLKQGLLSKKTFQRLKRILTETKVNIGMQDMDIKQVLLQINKDKKVHNNKVRFVLPTGIGKVIVSSDVPITVVKRALIYLKHIQ